MRNLRVRSVTGASAWMWTVENPTNAWTSRMSVEDASIDET